MSNGYVVAAACCPGRSWQGTPSQTGVLQHISRACACLRLFWPGLLLLLLYLRGHPRADSIKRTRIEEGVLEVHRLQYPLHILVLRGACMRMGGG